MKLGEVGTTFGGLTGKSKSDFGRGDAQYVTFVEVMEGARLRGRSLGRVVTQNGEKQAEIRRGDVLFNTSSEIPEEVALGAHVDFDVPPRVHLNSFCFGYRITEPGAVDPSFLAYFSRSGEGRRIVASLAQGATRYNISKTKLLEVPIALPSYQEQRAISDALTDCDDFIEALERLITKKRNVKQGMMQELLNGHTRLPGFAEEWQSRAFDEVMAVLNTRRSQVDASRYLQVGLYPVVDQGRQYIAGYVGPEYVPIHPGADGVCVFGDHTTITKYIDFDFVVGADGTKVLRSRCARDYDTRYICYLLESNPVESTGYNRHFGKLRARRFLMPSGDEQRAISKVLQDVDDEIEALERRLESARAVKIGMMQELLMGRTRLSVEEEA